MYWHTRHPGDLQALSSEAFADIAGILRPAEPTGPSADQTLTGLLSDFFAGLSEDDVAHLVHRLDVVFRSFQRNDLADQLDAFSDEVRKEAKA